MPTGASLFFFGCDTTSEIEEFFCLLLLDMMPFTSCLSMRVAVCNPSKIKRKKGKSQSDASLLFFFFLRAATFSLFHVSLFRESQLTVYAMWPERLKDTGLHRQNFVQTSNKIHPLQLWGPLNFIPSDCNSTASFLLCYFLYLSGSQTAGTDKDRLKVA